MRDLIIFRYQPFVAVYGNPGVKVPLFADVLSSDEQEIHSTTPFNKISIEFEFQTDRNVYVKLRQAYLAPKVKIVKGRCFDTYKTTEKKEHKKDTVFLKQGTMTLNF